MSQSDARFRSLFDTTPDLVIIMDDAGIVASVNASVEPMLGYSPEDLIGSPLTRIMPERFHARHEAGFRRYLQTGNRSLDWKLIELPGLNASGREVLLAVSFGEFEENGKRYFTGIVRDISTEKSTADRLEFLSRVGPALASSALDYRATLRTLAEMAVPFLADWSAVDITNRNGEVERLAVAHPDATKVALVTELATKYPQDPNARFGVPEVLRTGRPEVASEISPALLESTAGDAAHLGILKSLALRSYVVVPLAAHGRVYGALSLIQAESGRTFTEADVPYMEELGRRAGLAIHNAGMYEDALEANRMLEQQATELEQQTEEAQVLAEELEAQTQELTAANETKSAFLASMSHELRTPLNAIAGYVELLEMGIRGPVTPEQVTDLQRIRHSQHHLLALINDVLNFAKVEAGKLEYRADTISLDRVLKDCEAMVLPQIRLRNLRYTYDQCAAPVYVVADRDRVQQIVLNLLSNAIKFTDEGGEIHAVCDAGELQGRLHITDTGVGIEASKLETVFEPFVQIHRSLNQPGTGAGLGLAISRSLANAMGGDIVAASEPGVGSTFTLSLPAAPVEQEEDGQRRR